MKKLTMAVLIKCVLIIQIIGLINNANGETDRNARAIFATTEQPEITMQLRGDEHDVCFHNCEMNEFPLELAEKINELKDVEGFVNNFLEDEESLTNTTTYRSVRTRRAAVKPVTPRAAQCLPAPTVVSLRPADDKDPTINYFPSCTRVNRCGGCCTHKLLSCQPTEQNEIPYTISKSKYVGGSPGFQNMGPVQISVTEHTKCKCMCTITEADCNSLQIYEKSKCKCSCKNTDDQEKCFKENSVKIWENNSCSCVCRENKECSSGYHYDQNMCSCQPITDYDPDLVIQQDDDTQIDFHIPFNESYYEPNEDTKYETLGN